MYKRQLPCDRIKLINLDNPTTPSQTLNVNKTINMYISFNSIDKNTENIQNNLKIINSSLNKLIITCFRFKHREVMPDINIIKYNKGNDKFICFNSLKKI